MFFIFSVQKCAEKLSVPITCKIRVFEDIDKSIKYAQMLEKAGAQVIYFVCYSLPSARHNKAVIVRTAVTRPYWQRQERIVRSLSYFPRFTRHFGRLSDLIILVAL